MCKLPAMARKIENIFLSSKSKQMKKKTARKKESKIFSLQPNIRKNEYTYAMQR